MSNPVSKFHGLCKEPEITILNAKSHCFIAGMGEKSNQDQDKDTSSHWKIIIIIFF